MRIFGSLLLLFSLVSAQPHFILIGPPGSGKGTFSSYMKRVHGYYQICPGDILRTHIKNETSLGVHIKPIVENGNYIDDAIVLQIIDEHISDCLANQIPFIIDGFPRSMATLHALHAMFEKRNICDEIIFLHCIAPDELCIERIEQRVVCFSCFEVYNNKTRKPQTARTCDRCGNSLESRLGDTHANTIKRLAYFRKNIEPLIDAAQKLNYNAISFNADADIALSMQEYESLLHF